MDTDATILIVENDDSLIRALSKRLASHGFTCITAASGAQGLAAFRETPVDLILSDLHMPGGDGVAFAEAVRRSSNVPIIFITGFRNDFRRRLRAVSNIVTVKKPFDFSLLMDVISVALMTRNNPALLSTIMQEDE
jgi:two-component system response regulator GlrR